ncbi:hypothetical protein PC9H_002210 [Pleurotus ostreatus]|uniref:Uncharacterized protein n=1 Tax=Pleurotus ostreatus TaxID=5322 RepID=A0A8H6ZKW7_PLEOS|nr:uncharacterized protein PC9H_002210 [Pleurotus ostreatus]KAF7419619.1 hypothetical protein PC9H_002210 [Pleurotus ostreatus]KAJ8689520.1 hypothetical protein PTI98_012418 [Pleurotus ostreatus]
MVSTRSQLATILILVLGVSSVAGAPVSLKDLGHLETTNGKPVYHNNPVVYSKRVDESIATRSSKYAIDYLPTWAVAAPEAEPTKADAKKDTKMPNPSKYAIDYLPSWAVTAKAASATNEAEKDAAHVLMATTKSPAPPATTSTRALKYNISKYAIDYLPTRAGDVSEAEATVAAADEDKATPLATRSSKYAVDYHPTWVANGPAEATGAADEDKAAPIATRSSKYAVDYHPTWVAGTPVVEATAAADEQN